MTRQIAERLVIPEPMEPMVTDLLAAEAAVAAALLIVAQILSVGMVEHGVAAGVDPVANGIRYPFAMVVMVVREAWL